MNPPRTSRNIDSPTMAQLMGAVAAAGAICSLYATVRLLSDGSTSPGLNVLGVCIVGYAFYLVYLVWLSFSFFTRNQVLVLITATAALTSLAIEVAASASGWVVLAAMMALPIMPFGLGALMYRYGGHWVPERDVEGDTGTLALLVDSKRGRGLRPQREGPPEDLAAPRPRRGPMRRRTVAILLILATVVVGLSVAGIQVVRRRMHYSRLAAYHAREEERWFEEVLRLQDMNDADLAKDPESPSVQERVERRAILMEQLNKKADWHSTRRQSYEDRWW